MTRKYDDGRCWCGSTLKGKPHNCIGTQGRVEDLLDERSRLIEALDHVTQCPLAASMRQIMPPEELEKVTACLFCRDALIVLREMKRHLS